MKLKIGMFAGLLIASLLLTACMEPTPDPHEIKKIALTNGQLKTTFLIPATYRVRKKEDKFFWISFKYPSMEPLDPEGVPRPDEISVCIELFERMGSTERMVSAALEKFNPNKPGHEYHAGSEGIYQIYRHMRGREKSQKEITTYVFNAKDGALVGIEDPGDWSVNYEVRRKMVPNLQIRYLIAKPLGRNFVEIDNAVVTFINRHLQTATH